METVAHLAEGFIGLFQAGGENFMGLVTGILPTLLILITGINALIAIVGEEKVDKLALAAGKNIITRYTVLPFLSMFFLTNPMAYSMGRFLPEKQKPAFYDAAVSFCHPITGFFPHANSAELFVYMGIASGITTLGLSTSSLALRYLLVGLVVILIRGIVTEKITAIMIKRNSK